uniref:PDZ domain-containing protein n=1 Tax=Eptatretus burgeri TaxID=7764 RepID=A0A8C4N905_EPTBU
MRGRWLLPWGRKPSRPFPRPLSNFVTMGCSLCAFRKKEEQYRLLYEVCQVNGKDLSKATHEEAVEAFHAAKEPIVVQVLRRVPPSSGNSIRGASAGSKRHAGGMERGRVDASTQTEQSWDEHSHSSPATPPVPTIHPFLLGDSLTELGPDLDETSDFLQQAGERAAELEYEEVELYRLSNQEPLGLTVCYRTDDEDDTGIYVSEISPLGLAAKDGRIMEGDRIVQINGMEVRNREEAVAMLTRENSTNISLLLARPELQVAPVRSVGCGQYNGPVDEQLFQTAEKDSGLGRTDESSEHDAVTTKTEAMMERHSEGKNEAGLMSEEPAARSKQQQGCLLGMHCEVRRFSVFCEGGDGSASRCGSSSSVDREIELLNEELRRIELECQSIVRARGLLCPAGPEPWPPPSPPRSVATSPHRSPSRQQSTLPHITEGLTWQSHGGERRNGPLGGSSSGGDTPCISPHHSRVASAARSHPTLPSHSFVEVPEQASHYRSYMHLIQQRSAVDFAQSQTSLVGLCQDRRAMDSLAESAAEAQIAAPQSLSAPASPYEWKGRIRGQAARRPVRDRLLRQRALRIREERSGITTDDDALSELKTGRYWSKEERKQQLIHAREQRRRREFMLRSRLECLREGMPDPLPSSSSTATTAIIASAVIPTPTPMPPAESNRLREPNIIELSHRKMMKKRSKKILDNWMTIQELLAHGVKSPDGTRVYNPLLSVTTV